MVLMRCVPGCVGKMPRQTPPKIPTMTPATEAFSVDERFRAALAPTFWMVGAGLLYMASKLTEISLGVKYRKEAQAAPSQTAVRLRHTRENPGEKPRTAFRNSNQTWLTSAGFERPFYFSTFPQRTP